MMKKQLAIFSAVALLLMSGVGVSLAANSTTVVVNGEIMSSTCDVNVNDSSAITIRDAVQDFGASSAEGSVAKNNYESRIISVSNCSGVASGATPTAQVTINGATHTGKHNYFDDSGSKRIAVVVSKATDFTQLLANEEIVLGGSASIANGTNQELYFALVQAGSDKPVSGDKVTATFNFQYEEK